MRNFAQQALLFLKGLAMGAADVVPGVSGGTIAFVSGIYAELLRSITSVNLQALKLLRSEGVAAAWVHINGNFLAVLIAGILTSLFSLARVMQFLLAEHPLPLWSFFTGLIIGSVIYLLRQNPPRRKIDQLMFALGVVIAYGISIAPAVALEGNHVFCRQHCSLRHDFARYIRFFYSCAAGFIPCIYNCDRKFPAGYTAGIRLWRSAGANAVQPLFNLAIEPLPYHGDSYHVWIFSG